MKASKSFQFTSRALAALRPKAERYEVRGGAGLRLRVYPTGSKSLRWQGPPCRDVRCKGGRVHRHFFVLGNFDSKNLTGLADALKRLEELRTDEGHRLAVEALLGRGGGAPTSTPSGLKGSGAATSKPSGSTVAELAETFYSTVLVNRRKRPEIAKDVLDRDIAESIGSVLLADLTPDVCAKPVQAAVARGSPAHAVRVLQVLKQFTRWAVGMQHLARDPAVGLDAENLGAVIGQRDRFLTLAEVEKVLHGLDRAPLEESTRIAARVLLASGLRTVELLTLEWRDVDLEAATVSVRVENLKLGLKATRQRKGAPYVQPLNTYAVRLLKRQHKVTGALPFVFASWGESGRMTDRILSHAFRRMREEDAKLAKLAPFSPHDFRRTLATWASDTFDPMLAQQLLGHSVGGIVRSRVASTYDLGQGLDRKRAALDAWGSVLEGLDKPAKRQTAKVVAIR